VQSLSSVQAQVTECRACPRLVAWREEVAREKRAAYRNEEYWGRPIPGFGDPAARVLVLGLAPAAHGGNRTGRVFTGDRSGDWLYRAMHRAGLANQATSTHRGDGLALSGAYVTAAVRCAPPANKPLPEERDRCRPWLLAEWACLAPTVRVVVCLGKFAYDAVGAIVDLPSPRPRFGHGVEVATTARDAAPGAAGSGPTVVCSFHPSQQNTFTGRLTEPMLDAVFNRAVALASEA
jgi:uracil-DNA glycosylase